MYTKIDDQSIRYNLLIATKADVKHGDYNDLYKHRKA